MNYKNIEEAFDNYKKFFDDIQHSLLGDDVLPLKTQWGVVETTKDFINVVSKCSATGYALDTDKLESPCIGIEIYSQMLEGVDQNIGNLQEVKKVAVYYLTALYLANQDYPASIDEVLFEIFIEDREFYQKLYTFRDGLFKKTMDSNDRIEFFCYEGNESEFIAEELVLRNFYAKSELEYLPKLWKWHGAELGIKSNDIPAIFGEVKQGFMFTSEEMCAKFLNDYSEESLKEVLGVH